MKRTFEELQKEQTQKEKLLTEMGLEKGEEVFIVDVLLGQNILIDGSTERVVGSRFDPKNSERIIFVDLVNEVTGEERFDMPFMFDEMVTVLP